MSEQQQQTHFLNEKIAKLEANCQTLSSDFVTLKAAHNDLTKRFEVVETENRQYKASMHAALVEKAISARKTAGIGDETVDRITFAKFEASALDTIITDANKITEQKKATKQTKTNKNNTNDGAYDETANPPDTTEGEGDNSGNGEGDNEAASLAAALQARMASRGIPLTATVSKEGQ
jgi:hypothetical protein